MESPEEPFHTENKGAANGINPFFGVWRKEFKFSPVSYSARSERRQEFKERLQGEIGCSYYFTNEVKVDITLHLDEQRVNETDSTADVDNFAKGILDCLKGMNGILIDDCQIQSLSISWIDVYSEEEWFEIEIRGHPDEYMLRDVSLYEMPDGLWYPLSNMTWDKGDAKLLAPVDAVAGPLILEAMTYFSKKIRAEFRLRGLTRMQAYRQSQYFATSARGFHKSRVEGQFPLLARKVWQESVSELAEKDPGSAKAVLDALADFKSKKDDRLMAFKKTRPAK